MFHVVRIVCGIATMLASGPLLQSVNVFQNTFNSNAMTLFLSSLFIVTKIIKRNTEKPRAQNTNKDLLHYITLHYIT